LVIIVETAWQFVRSTRRTSGMLKQLNMSAAEVARQLDVHTNLVPEILRRQEGLGAIQLCA